MRLPHWHHSMPPTPGTSTGNESHMCQIQPRRFVLASAFSRRKEKSMISPRNKSVLAYVMPFRPLSSSRALEQHVCGDSKRHAVWRFMPYWSRTKPVFSSSSRRDSARQVARESCRLFNWQKRYLLPFRRTKIYVLMSCSFGF